MDPTVERAQHRVGQMLRDKWRIDRLIGVGGMAAVYSATHRNGMRVAVKMLHPEISLNKEIRQRFLREGYVANAVEHPGAVRVFDDDTSDDGSVFLVMELLVGETLDSRWEKSGKRLSLGEAMGTANAVLDVLAAAHDKQIVHRDIKPENIFLVKEGGIKVLDFGIARLREATAQSNTVTGSLMGTPAYMAPEQARGRWDDVDARTDVWAVGATMFTTLTGRYVHEADTVNEVLLAAMTRPAPPLSSVAPHLPRDLCTIVDTALAFDRTQRWPTARTMQQALQGIAAMGEAQLPTVMFGQSGSNPSVPHAPSYSDPSQAHIPAVGRQPSYAQPQQQQQPSYAQPAPPSQQYAPPQQPAAMASTAQSYPQQQQPLQPLPQQTQPHQPAHQSYPQGQYPMAVPPIQTGDVMTQSVMEPPKRPLWPLLLVAAAVLAIGGGVAIAAFVVRGRPAPVAAKSADPTSTSTDPKPVNLTPIGTAGQTVTATATTTPTTPTGQPHATVHTTTTATATATATVTTTATATVTTTATATTTVAKPRPSIDPHDSRN